MGRETNIAAGAVGAGVVAAGLGAAYLAHRFLQNPGAPQPRHHHHHHQSPRQVSGIPSGPYMSVYMPTQTADVILPMHRNGRTTNAYGYMHQ